jgi:hypothetical protein
MVAAETMTAQQLRFVGIWTALSLAAQAIYFGFAPPLARSGDAIYLLMAVGYAATPLAQALALRSAPVRWGREWAFAGIAGAIFVAAALGVARTWWINAGTVSLFVTLSAAAIILLQALVLRRHSARVVPWIAAAAAVWAIERAAQWLVTGSLFPGPGAPPPSYAVRVLVTGITALLEAAVLAWVVLAPRVRGEARADWSATSSRWLWLEWTASAPLALLTILGVAALISGTVGGGLETIVTRWLIAAVAGLAIGGAQWLVLRGRLTLPPAWLAVSAAALAVPTLPVPAPIIATLIGFAWTMAMFYPLGTAVAGAWFGFCQWLVLRRYAPRAILWIPATSIAWAMVHLRGYPASLSPEAVGLAAGAISGLAVLAIIPPADSRQTGGSAKSPN